MQLRHWLLFACLWCIGSSATARELNLGVISMRPEYHQPRLEALAKVIAPKLGAHGITGFHIVMARDAAQMKSLLAAGKVDWLTSTLANALSVQANGSARIFLTAASGDGRSYKTLFFTRTGSQINQLADLRGRRLALRAKGSTSSYTVPLHMLGLQHLPLQRLRSIRDPLLPDHIGIMETGSETNCALMVLHGLADMGVANSLDWEDQRLFPPRVREGLQVAFQSPPVPLGVELLRADLDPKLAKALTEALLQAHLDPAGASAIKIYAHNADHFESISAPLARELKRFADAINQLPPDFR
jgi:phosphonate transport system substrate-binding protein